MAGAFERWATQLRLSWMGQRAQRIVGGWAAVLGDKTLEWARQAQLEHLPEHALDAKSLALRASETGIEPGPNEVMSDLATRLTYQRILNQLRGRPLGLALALHYAEFPGFVIVQQNGRAWQITGTPVLDDLVDAVAPPSWVTMTELGTNPVISGSPPWWLIDTDLAFCSRFGVLFPGPVFPSSFVTHGVATFTASDRASVVWNNAFADETYAILPGPPIVTDSSGVVAVGADGATQTTTGVDIIASHPFTGYVHVLAHELGANPHANPHPQDLARLRRVVAEWRPGKATCDGIYVVVQGLCTGWPVGVTGDYTDPGASHVVRLSPE